MMKTLSRIRANQSDQNPVRRKSLPVWLMLTAWLAVAPLWAQQVSVKVELDTNNILIGDQINLTMQFSGPSNLQVVWPELPDTIQGKIDVLNRTVIDTQYNKTRSLFNLSQQILITSFDTGFYTIPSIRFYFRTPQDSTLYVAESRRHFLAVHTVAVDTTKPIRPIKGPMKVPMTWREILPWLLITLAVLAGITFLIYYLVKRKKNQPVFSLRPKVILKPHEKALASFEKLRVKKLWQQGQVKAYYTELTDIIRIYIEEQFTVPAMESTTAEILHILIDEPAVKRETLDELEQLLVQADMVKFAKDLPTPDTNERSLERGIRFVNATVPVDPGKTEL